MKTLRIPNGWYCDATPTGPYVAQVKGGGLVTHLGPVPLPPGQSQLLFLRIHPSGLGFAGIGQQGDLAWVWDGAAWTSNGLAYGPNSVIFRADGSLVVAHDGSVTGSQGWRTVADDGTLVTGDSSYADPARGIWEYTTHGDVTVGQGGDEEGCQALVAGRRVLLEVGWCRTIRFNRAGPLLSVAMMKPTESVLLWGTRAELDALPTYTRPAPAPRVATIGAPTWLAWFTFGTPAVLPPGNATIPVPDLTLRARTGEPIATYVAGANETNLADLEAAITAAKAKGLPVLAYWPRQVQSGALPRGADWVGVEAYQLRTESLTAFEARVTAALNRCSRPALICQAYSSNTTLTADLVPLVAVYARLAASRPGMPLLVFSAGPGRVTGLEDHPEIRPWWQALAAGIPGPPPITVTPQPPTGGAVLEILNVAVPDTLRVGVPSRVLFDVRSDGRIVSTTVDLIGDGQEGWTLNATDARLSAGVVIRPKKAGRFELRISATTATGQTARTGLTRWVTVLP